MYKRINVHHMYKVRVSGPVKSYTHSRSGVCICRLNNAFYVSPFTAPLGFHMHDLPTKRIPKCWQRFYSFANRKGRVCLLFSSLCIVYSENEVTPHKSTRVGCDKFRLQENFFSANSGRVCLTPSTRPTGSRLGRIFKLPQKRCLLFQMMLTYDLMIIWHLQELAKLALPKGCDLGLQGGRILVQGEEGGGGGGEVAANRKKLAGLGAAHQMHRCYFY